MTVMEMDRHGTYSRYTQGACRCDECRAAATAYKRDYRRRNPDKRQEDKQQAKDFGRAEAILRERHRAEFDAIYAEIRGAS